MKATIILITSAFAGFATVGAPSGNTLPVQPKGEITKSVQNITSVSTIHDANEDALAVSAKTGDTLKYIIEVRNTAEAQGNDGKLFKAVLTDTLPEGIELKDAPGQRTITADLGEIKAGDKVTKEYLVKVVATKSGIITNEACFSGNNEKNDSEQKGCDAAKANVTAPEQQTPPPAEPPKETTPAPQPTQPGQPTPTVPQTSSTSTVAPVVDEDLPKTGPESVVAPALLAGVAGYAGFLRHLKRRATRR